MKKIMFDDACSLTQAVKGGRKTNTRRQEKALDKEVQKHEETYKVPFSIVSQYYDFGKERLVIKTPKEVIYVKPRYKVGDVVAVAEAYKDVPDLEPQDLVLSKGEYIPACMTQGWANKEFVRADIMPERLRITDVRVERLQDISDEDCIMEGVFLDETAPSCYQPFYTFPGSIDYDTPVGYKTPREAFAALIDKVSGKDTWKKNPWVFVYDFELAND